MTATLTHAGPRPQRSRARPVSRPHDEHERQADQAAEVVARGGSVAGWSFASVPVSANPPVQRQEAGAPKSEDEKKKEALTKAGEAALETPQGKALKEKVLADPLVKSVKDAVTSPAGLAIGGAAVAGGVGALAATGKELPFQPPSIPLDRFKPGLSAQVTYTGPVNAPTQVGLTITYKEQGPKGTGPRKTATERQREENAKLAAEQEAFRRGLRYAPGSKEAEEQRLADEAIARFISPHSGLPGFTIPLTPPQPKKEEPAAPAQRQPSSTTDTAPAPAHVDDVLASGGRALDPSTRRSMEERFGYDFARVRVHDDARAAAAAASMDAAGFTVGQDVVFGAGRYDPSSAAGRRLLAHELAHVVQQSHGGARLQRCGRGACPAGTCDHERDLDAPRDPGALPPAVGWDGEQAGEKEDGGAVAANEGGGPATAPTVPTASKSPCGGGSMAATYTPTDKGVTPKVDPSDPNEFGTTSKLAAGFEFGACKTPSDWRFHLKSLTVQVASAVQDLNWKEKTHVKDENDAAVTDSSYPAVVRDLSPTAKRTAKAKCAGKEHSQEIKNYSRRKAYWNRQLVIDHEAFHRKDWDKLYRAELTLAEQQVWGHKLPVGDAANEGDAIAKARRTLTDFMIAAYNPRACDAYAPEQEVRAYDDGAAKYQSLVDAIRARATKEKWPAEPGKSP